MTIKVTITILFLAHLCQSCWECKPDKYGEILELVVPITTSPAKDTFNFGDTLTIEADFDKDIEIYNTAYTIRLDSFNFFGLFGISEISDTIENYLINIDTIVAVGKVGYLPLYDNVIAYPVEFHEDETGYHLAFKIVLNTKGRFWVNLSSSSFLYEKGYYEHPALYACEKNRRDRVQVYFINTSTKEEAFQDIFLKTQVEYLHRLVDYEDFQKAGSISFIVQKF